MGQAEVGIQAVPRIVGLPVLADVVVGVGGGRIELREFSSALGPERHGWMSRSGSSVSASKRASKASRVNEKPWLKV